MQIFIPLMQKEMKHCGALKRVNAKETKSPDYIKHKKGGDKSLTLLIKGCVVGGFVCFGWKSHSGKTVELRYLR